MIIRVGTRWRWGCACSPDRWWAPRSPPRRPGPPPRPAPALPSALVTVCPELTPTLDTRAVTQAVVPSTATRDGLKALLAESSSGARATWDERFGTLRSLRASGP